MTVHAPEAVRVMMDFGPEWGCTGFMVERGSEPPYLFAQQVARIVQAALAFRYTEEEMRGLGMPAEADEGRKQAARTPGYMRNVKL